MEMYKMLCLIVIGLQLQLFAVEKLVILGGGPAGMTAAIFAGQLHLEPCVVLGEEIEGQYSAVYRIENFPGFPEGISGCDLNEKLMRQAANFGTTFLQGKAVHVDLSRR